MGRISIDFESNTSTSTNANANANASAINTGKKDLSSPSIEILKTNQSRNQNQNRNQNPITFSSESYGNGLRLTKEEEVELCQSIQELKAIMQTRDQLAMDLANAHEHAHAHTEEHAQDETNKNWNTLIAIKRPFLPTPTEEEWALACNNISTPHELKLKLLHGKESRAKLVSYNLGLVLQIAKRYDYELKKSIASGGGNGVGTILTCSDLIQEGNMGLLEAAERFDAGRGVRFATYAGYWVKQRILRAITENSRVIRLPAHGELNFSLFCHLLYCY
jgi:DNA-directed RNA polymerase sigma subunit (sigma70/sigma32)